MMNKLKQQIDNELNVYRLSRNVDELFVKHKKEKRKKLSAAIATFCIILAVSAAVSVNFGMPGGRNSLALKASAFDIKSRSSVIGGEKTMLCPNGVQAVSKKAYYDSKGKEVFEKKSHCQSFTRLVLVPSPISLSIVGDDIKSYVVTCTENGTVYNSGSDNLNNRKTNYKGNESINWIPNCEKLSRSIKADMTMYPSTISNDRLLKKELSSALRTADDYTTYFGDTLRITARYKNNSTETLKAVITLDEKGSYYISTQKE